MGLEIGFFIGAVVLLAAIVYGATANTRRNRANDAVTAKATKELYKNPESYPEKEGDLRASTRD